MARRGSFAGGRKGGEKPARAGRGAELQRQAAEPHGTPVLHFTENILQSVFGGGRGAAGAGREPTAGEGEKRATTDSKSRSFAALRMTTLKLVALVQH